jgi:hypothetical protein
MKQKYMILKSEEKSELIIREFAELDKDAMSLLCEETYDAKTIESAIAKDKEALIVALRTPNMYPAGIYADKIADSVIALYQSGDKEATEVFFDDFEYISASRKRGAKLDEGDGETSQIEDLLEEEYDEEFDEKPALDKLNSSIKVDEDDITDFEEDS